MSYIAIHPTKPKKSRQHSFGVFDKLVLVVSVLYPLSALPQAIAVFSGHAGGVSIVSWGFFLVCATLFLSYGLRRKVLPMIISNSIWLVMDALVVIGIIVQGSVVLI